MAERSKDNILLIEDTLETPLHLSAGAALQPIQKKFIESYVSNKDKMPVNQWLPMELQSWLPEKTADEIAAISTDIITTLELSESKKGELEGAIAQGRSKESWFADEAVKATSQMSAQEASNYLQNLDGALSSANESLYGTTLTQAKLVSCNPNLDGFIAEQYHAQTFNLNAEASGSPYRAKVLEPEGTAYTKNSVDIVITDGAGKTVKRYQSKYCKDANATAKAFKDGDYRGQQKLVPEEQAAEISKRCTAVLEAPDGTTSKPLTKSAAKELQNEAQSGKWNDLNWNSYSAKDLALGVGKQAGQAALLGAAVGVGFELAQKAWNGEKIDGAEIVETALTSGADFGVKAAVAGAVKVGAEKGIIKAIPKGTPAGTIANVVFVAIENIKVIGKMATGELTAKEGLEKMEQVTVSAVAGIVAGAKGAAIGAQVGVVFGPVGATVGGFVGGMVGYMAGSKVGEVIVKGKQKIQEKAREIVKTIEGAVRSGISSFCQEMKSGLRAIWG